MTSVHTRLGSLLLACIIAVSLPNLSTAAITTPTITAPGVLAFTNAERAERGLPALTNNDTLAKVAATKMTDLFARQYFAHEAPTGEDVSDLVKEAGYRYLTVGENLALGDFTSSRHVVQAWMDSPGHKANILSKAYSEIGIAAGKSTYEGRSVWIAVQSFGLPLSSCPQADQLLRKKVEAQGKTLELLQGIAAYRKKALDTPGVSRAVFTVRADLYNKVVARYNKDLETYRSQAALYNKQIDKFNTCIKKKTRK